MFCLFTLLNSDITTLLKVESADTTVDKNNYHRKDLNSNLGTFHRFKLVAKTDHQEGKQKVFKINKSRFSQKATVQIKNP